MSTEGKKRRVDLKKVEKILDEWPEESAKATCRYLHKHRDEYNEHFLSTIVRVTLSGDAERFETGINVILTLIHSFGCCHLGCTCLTHEDLLMYLGEELGAACLATHDKSITWRMDRILANAHKSRESRIVLILKIFYLYGGVPVELKQDLFLTVGNQDLCEWKLTKRLFALQMDNSALQKALEEEKKMVTASAALNSALMEEMEKMRAEMESLREDLYAPDTGLVSRIGAIETEGEVHVNKIV